MHLFKTIYVVFLIGVSFCAVAQSPDELDKRNGFKDIKLASEVHQYEGLEFKEEVEDEDYKRLSVYHRKKGYYESIGTVKVHDVVVSAYNGEITQIQVITEKNPKLFAGLKKVFGKPTFSPRGDNYYWSTEKVGLSFGKYNGTKLQLVYSSYAMKDRLKQDEEDEIEAISDDF